MECCPLPYDGSTGPDLDEELLTQSIQQLQIDARIATDCHLEAPARLGQRHLDLAKHPSRTKGHKFVLEYIFDELGNAHPEERCKHL